MFWGRRFSAAAARHRYIPIKLYGIAIPTRIGCVMAPSGFRLRRSEPRLCGKGRAHAGGAVKESDDCADQDSAPRPCGKCPAGGGRRERRHQEAEGGLRCSFRNPAAQPEMALTACMFWESLPHTLRCGPCFGACPFPAPHRVPDCHPAGAQGWTVGERGGASHGGTADSTWALVDAAEIIT